jgi:S1-C subfamily serine protease
MAVCWLGCITGDSAALPAGSGVVVHRGGNEYLVTALHVGEDCNFSPVIRRRGQWQVPSLEFVVRDEDTDIAIFRNVGTSRLSSLTPEYGLAHSIIGTVGRAVGFPTTGKPEEDTKYIVEMDGIPIPICAPICSYANMPLDHPQVSVAAGYINRGFSGGAVLFPTNDDWKIVGIITHRLSVPAYGVRADKDGKPVDRDERILIQEPSGLFRYTNFCVVEQLID